MTSKEKHKRLSILVIEDNEMYRQIAVEMLAGNDVKSALDGNTGIELFSIFRPHITFLDIGLPDKNGHEVLEELLEKDPNAFIVMLTASNVSSDVDEALTLGAKGYIIKPFARQKIKDIIKKYNQENPEG